ncbi:response regulator transcription factor [Roseibium denhamense]|uniref:Two component transcriptional regulator, LuxR family n=1 Tax=Roseibium denhamense TaxID=76305 RepID=A0ABY1P8L9_9HYPH|nr:DNA-binding response regulator [Roseibium denhamense]MTI07195.1 response regulator transcription factor [Roseibium denhamense]SMP26681.1 two component transcriptional regulator, LuxR family [Roseibium denhamense]
MTDKHRDTVLVVDDSPESLGFVTEALRQTGVTVLVATSGAGALSVCEKITPDTILMDAVMPGLDGFDTCRKIKDSPGLQNVPVIFMTGLSETEHIVKALDSGGVDFLTKPINIDELKARIKVHLKNARSVQSAHVALDAAGRHLVAVSSDGAVQWATPQIQSLLERTGAADKSLFQLGKALGTWLDKADQTEVRRTSFMLGLSENLSLQLHPLGRVGPDENLFRVTAEDEASQVAALQEQFGLTQREAEVLIWIAKGKANKDIAEILQLSPRTVNKHLEQIFIKLGVENRAAAAVRAAEVIFSL